MDINRFIRKMTVQLGINSLGLEDKFLPIIHECLTTDTMNTFAQYFPYDYKYKLDLSNTKPIREDPVQNSKTYYIRDKFMEENNMEILSVVDVQGTNSFDYMNSPPVAFNVESMILESAASSTRSLLNLSTRDAEYLPPNMLKLIGYTGTNDIYIIVKTQYPNFGAISPSVSWQLERLAKLDIKLWLYPELKMYDNLDVGAGTINLKLDGWENAENEKQSLLEEFATKNFGNMAHFKRHFYE